MRDSNSLLEQQARRLSPRSNVSPTAAGPTGSSTTSDGRARGEATPTSEHVDAINQIFTELELAYHNQFHKAFPNDQQLMMAKQLWLHSLCDLSPARLRAGVRRAIKSAPYLPTVQSLRAFCEPSPADLGIPDVHVAYVEACRAPSPKPAYKWSHPIVYHAGRASDWHFLASTPESKALPVFRRHYELLTERVLNGEALDLPIAKALPEEVTTPLTAAERRARLQQLRDETGI